MSDSTGIEWTDATWNPVVGCTPVSPGCLNCYAATMARRLEAMGRPEYVGLSVRRGENDHEAGGGRGRDVFSGTVRCLDDRLTAPLHWRKPRRVFVCSMADLFHEAVPFEFVDRVFAVMALCPQHTFQVLTKRPERMREWFSLRLRDTGNGRRGRVGGLAWSMAGDVHFMGSALHRTQVCLDWPLPNVWLGVSAERQQELDERVPRLLECPAAVRFLSCEPLLGPLDLECVGLMGDEPNTGDMLDGERIQWVIVGGESGPHARPCVVEWVRSIVQQCKAAGVPVFVKQLGRWIAGENRTFPFDGLVHQWLIERDGKRCVFTTPILGLAYATEPDYRHERPAGAIAFRVSDDGKHGDPAEWPEDLRVREWPAVAGEDVRR